MPSVARPRGWGCWLSVSGCVPAWYCVICSPGEQAAGGAVVLLAGDGLRCLPQPVELLDRVLGGGARELVEGQLSLSARSTLTPLASISLPSCAMCLEQSATITV